MHVLMLNDGTMICPGGLLDAVQIVGEELSQELAKLIELEVKKNLPGNKRTSFGT